MRTLTPKIVGEILFHEGLVREAYRDSRGIWTWSVGITDASGHRVKRYRDNPQPLARCLEVFMWLLTTRYLPAVLAAFGARDPAEHELAAALSFHYNTGAIGRAAWLRHHLAGNRAAARGALLDWRRPPEILSRRRAEQALFFDDHWSGDGTVLVYDVAKPSYQPTRPKRVQVAPLIVNLLTLSEPQDCEVDGLRPPSNSALMARQDRQDWFDRLF